MRGDVFHTLDKIVVSMKSGLEGRNNECLIGLREIVATYVSMKSGLEGRNNETAPQERC